jgi:hypothetical protein
MINVSLIVFVLDHLIIHQGVDELYLTKEIYNTKFKNIVKQTFPLCIDTST